MGILSSTREEEKRREEERREEERREEKREEQSPSEEHVSDSSTFSRRTHYQLINIISPNKTAPETYTTETIGLIEINSTSIGLNTTTSGISLNQSMIVWGTKSNTRPSDQFPRKGLRAWQWGLIAMGVALFVIIAVLLLLLLMKEKFHVIFIPKTLENDEWGSA
jgi:hypothetical protein